MHRVVPRLLSGLLVLGATGAAAQPATRPNIIFILADDLGYGDLGSYGQKIIQTPNLDRLALEGLRFTQFYAGSTVCAPSRSVLMTGQHMGHTRVRGNAGADNYASQTLDAGDVTVARVLQQAGYATALIGKWGLGEADSAGAPNRHGFDEFYGVLNQTHAHNHYPDFLWRNTEKRRVAQRRHASGRGARRRLCDPPRAVRQRPVLRGGARLSRSQQEPAVLPLPVPDRAARQQRAGPRPRRRAGGARLRSLRREGLGRPAQGPGGDDHADGQPDRRSPGAGEAARARGAHARHLHERQRPAQGGRAGLRPRLLRRERPVQRHQAQPDRRRHPRAVPCALAGPDRGRRRVGARRLLRRHDGDLSPNWRRARLPARSTASASCRRSSGAALRRSTTISTGSSTRTDSARPCCWKAAGRASA